MLKPICLFQANSEIKTNNTSIDFFKYLDEVITFKDYLKLHGNTKK